MKLEIAKEYPVPGEDQAVDEFLELTKAHVNRVFATGTMKRDAHPKAHGCVRAEFTVEANLAPELRVGVFREPKTYQAWIRFSNAGDPKADSVPDLRGMAIKLMRVEGEKNIKADDMQDFLLVSYPTFMSGNITEFVRFTRAVENGTLSFLWYLFNPFRWRYWVFKTLELMATNPGNMLALKYFSITPYLFGSNAAVKYAAFPQTSLPNDAPQNPGDNFLRDVLKKTLSQQEVVFDFFVQFQTDADKMPVEDATVLWDSPFRKVATIRIPVQTFDSPEQNEFCENLSFSPWHSLVEHRPLGSLNRARKRVYEAMSQFRHEKNNAPVEPRKEHSS